MQNFHLKSIILGMGIGIILTSFISIIFFAGVNPNARMTDAEVMERAEQLGMVDGAALIKDKTDNGNDVGQNDDDKKSVGQDDAAQSDVDQIETLKPQISLNINSGDTAVVVAQKLLNLGLISDEISFVKILTDQKIQSKIVAREYKIKPGTDMKEIAQIITEK